MIKKRVVSLLLAASMMANSAGSMVYAEEVVTVQSESVTEQETEEKDVNAERILTLKYYEECTYEYEKEKECFEKDPDTKDISLLYLPQEEVRILVHAAEGMQVDEARLLDEDKQEYVFQWKNNKEIVFDMPDADVTLKLSFAEEDVETEDMETVGKEETEEVVLETEEVMQEETVSDGLPLQNSIVQAEAISIPVMTKDVDLSVHLENIHYDLEQYEITYISDTVDWEKPGFYDCIYRVDQKGSERFWFVLRPVRIVQGNEETKSETETKDPDAQTETTDGEEKEEPEPETSVETQPETEKVAEGDADVIRKKVTFDVQEGASVFVDDLDVTNNIGYAKNGKILFLVTLLDGYALADEAPVLVDHHIPARTTDIAGEYIIEGIQTDETIVTIKTKQVEMEESTEAVPDADMAEMDAVADDETKVLEPQTEALTEEGPSTNTQVDTYLVEYTKSDDYECTFNHADLLYTEGEMVTFAVALKEGYALSSLLASAGDEQLDIFYEPESETFHFEMPKSDVVLKLMAEPAVMLLAEGETEIESETEVDEDPVPDKFKLVIKGMSIVPASLNNGNASTSNKKVVFYEEDGSKVTRTAYCIQPKASTPGSGHTYDKDDIEILDGSSTSEKMMMKGMYYLYGGPAWGKSIDYADGSGSTNLKKVLSNHGCSTTEHYYAVCHYILSYIYMGGKNWNYNSSDANVLNDAGVDLVKNVVSKLKKLPVPVTQLSESSLTAFYDAASKKNVTQTITYKAIEENTAKITLPDGITLVNETTGKKGSGSVTLSGGDKFHLEAGTDITERGTYALKCTYAVEYTAMKLVLSGKQDIGFSYYSGDKTLYLTVDWPSLASIQIEKLDAKTKSKKASDGYDLDGAVYGIYADAACTSLLESLTIKNGSAISSKNYRVGNTYYVREDQAPPEYEQDMNIYPAKILAEHIHTPLVVTSNEMPKSAAIVVQKTDAMTGTQETIHPSYSFLGAQYGIYADAACTQLLDTIQTNEKGYAHSSKEYLIGTYYVKETVSPAFYELDETVHTVKITKEAVASGADITCKSKETPKKISIRIQKIDAKTKEAAPITDVLSFAGAAFGIYTDASCEEASLSEVVVTDKDGVAESKKEYLLGDYYIKELQAPEGYLLNEDVFVVSEEQMKTVLLEKKPLVEVVIEEEVIRGSLSLMKFFDTGMEESYMQDLYEKGILEGIRFILRHESSDVEEIELVTDRYGHAKTDERALLYGTWYLTEDPQSVPDGFDSMKESVIKITADAEELKYVISDKAIQSSVKILKKDADTGNIIPVSGASFELYDRDGNAVVMPDPGDYGKLTNTFATNENGEIFLTRALLKGSYTLREVRPPKGYVLGEPLTFQVKKHNRYEEPFVVEYFNEPQMGEICITKIDEASGTHLGEGFAFEVYTSEDIKDASGQIRKMNINEELVELKAGTYIQTIRTDKNGVAKTQPLYLGSYVVKESMAGEYYAISDKEYPVTITGNTTSEMVVADIAIANTKTSFTLQKIDSENADQNLFGVTFRILSSSDKEAEKMRLVAEEVEALRMKQEEDRALFLNEQEAALGAFVSSQEKDLAAFLEKQKERLDAFYQAEPSAEKKELFLSAQKDALAEFQASQETAKNLFFTKQANDLTVFLSDQASKKNQMEASGANKEESSAFLEAQKEEKEAFLLSAETEKEEFLAVLADAKEAFFEQQKEDLKAFLDSEKPDEEKKAVFEQAAASEKAAFYQNQSDEKEAFLEAQRKDALAYERTLETERKDLENERLESLLITDLNALGCEYTTDEHGQIHLFNLLHGNTYFVFETQTLPGYNMDPTIHEFTVDENGLIGGKASYALTLTNTAIVVDISKMDITGEKELSGAELMLSNSDGVVVDRWISGEMPKRIKGLPAGVYTLTEVKAPSGYATADPLTFTVTESYEVQKVIMYDELLQVAVSKRDITGDEELPGAELIITDEKNTEVERWISTEEAHLVNLPLGTYTLTEVTAPKGYATAESIQFTVEDTGTIQQVVMKDKPLEVEILKQDITSGEEIAGAHLMVKNEAGEVIDSWVSETTAHKITNIPKGIYTLTEELAPSGYATAQELTFEVKDTNEIQSVVMKDAPIKVHIRKSDITSAQPVIGAELIIKDMDGNEVERWITTKEDHVIDMLPVGSYTLTEITTPHGYATAETITFEVLDTEQIQTVEMFDAPLQVAISKKDITNDEELPGATLIVKDADGNEIEKWVSERQPHLIRLPMGTYTLTEITAPFGYELSETITFTVQDQIQVQVVTMYDAPKEETVDLTGKTDKRTKETLSGGYRMVPVLTGDETETFVWFAFFLLSLTALIVVSLTKKREHKK